MNQTSWPLNRWVVLLLAATYLVLLLEIRFDHNNVVLYNRLGWVPIVYSGVMVAAALLTAAFWRRVARAAMLWLFGAGVIVGLLGFWLHSGGHPVSSLRTLLSVWAGQTPDPTAAPPLLAPLSFAGLGALGWLACLGRLQPEAVPVDTDALAAAGR